MMSENKLYRARIAPAGSQKNLDDLVCSNALAGLRKDPNLKNNGNGGPVPQQEQAFVASLVRRLNEVEAANGDLNQRVAQLQIENEQLQTKLIQAAATSATAEPASSLSAPASRAAAVLHTSSGARAPDAALAHLQEEASRLRKQCKAAWAQVADMKQFLNDHGLVWVGNQASADAAAAPASSAAALKAPEACAVIAIESPNKRPQQQEQQEGLPCSLDALLCAVDELNRIAGDGIGRVAVAPSKRSAARLQTPEPVPLVLFKDGLQLADHAPRPYTDATALAILTDILDGFFPSVLKRDHPDGVPLCVMDRTRECMAAAAAAVPGKMRTFDQLGKLAANDKDALLARLPQTVIKNGRIVDVRSSSGEFMSGSVQQAAPASQDTAGVQRHLLSRADSAGNTAQAGPLGGSSGTLDTGAAHATQQPAASKSECSDGSTGVQMTTLQVKSEKGNETFVLKLKYTDTIAMVRRCIDVHRGSVGTGRQQQYEVRSRMPATTYSDESQSLEQAGLVPNATLFLKAC